MTTVIRVFFALLLSLGSLRPTFAQTVNCLKDPALGRHPSFYSAPGLEFLGSGSPRSVREWFAFQRKTLHRSVGLPSE